MYSLVIRPIFGLYKYHAAVDGVRITLSTVLSIILNIRYVYQEDNTEPSETLDCSRERYITV